MCGSIVDIQSAAAEIRRGKKKKKKKQTTGQKYNGLPYSIGRKAWLLWPGEIYSVCGVHIPCCLYHSYSIVRKIHYFSLTEVFAAELSSFFISSLGHTDFSVAVSGRSTRRQVNLSTAKVNLQMGQIASLLTVKSSRRRVKRSSPQMQVTASHSSSTTSTACVWRTQHGHPWTSASVVGVCAWITTWRAGTVAWTLLHIVVAYPLTSCCNCYLMKGSLSRCRRGCCQYTSCAVSDDDSSRTTVTSWTYCGTSTRASVARHPASIAPPAPVVSAMLKTAELIGILILCLYIVTFLRIRTYIILK